MRRNKILFASLFVFLGLTAGLVLSSKSGISASVESQPLEEKAAASTGSFSLESAVVNVAKTTGKAVVSISTEHTTKIPGGRSYYFSYPFGGNSPFGGDEFFREFFDDFFGEMPDREYKQRGLGSGVIIDKEGYILTNEHVVEDADKITVTLPDGREFKGEVKGKDARSDLAVIKINAKNLPVADLGDSDDLKIGEWVVAIGNPFGFVMENPEPTVTAGVISALHRSLGTVLARNRDYSDLIQTDAAINPGNSGGPLANLKGEVVGVNVAIFSTSGGYQGIGFAIPVNSARRVISKLIEGKKVLYGWLGVTVQDLTDDLAEYFGLPNTNGVLVAKVLKDSPAAKAGIKESDIITRINGEAADNVKDLLKIIAKADVGSRAEMVIKRENKDIAVKVEIGERPDNLQEAEEETVSAEQWRGIEVEELDEQKARRFGISQDKGVLIVGVEPGSSADEAGLMPLDVILEIDKKPVEDISDYKKITKEIKADTLIKTVRGFFLVKADGKEE